MYINTPVHAGTCIVRIIWEQFDALWCGCERLCRCTHMCSCMRSTWCIFAHLLQRHNHNFSSGSAAVMKRQSNGVLFFLFSYHLHNQNTTTPTLTTTNKKNIFFSFTRAKKKNRNKFTSTAGNQNRVHSVQLHRYVFIVRLFCFLSLLSVANPGCRHSQSHTVYDRSMRTAQ